MTGPVAPQRNPPIHPEYYMPSVFQIANITLGKFTGIETTVSNNYVVGQLVRFIVPSPYGTRQLNEQQGLILSIVGDSQFITDNNTANSDTFIPNPTYPGPIAAQVMAIGDLNNSSTPNNLSILGAFQNISPQ